MNLNEIEIKIDLKKYLYFFVVIFCFVAIPASILSYSVYRYFQINEEQLVYNLKRETQKMTSELRRNIDAEKYFCKIFHEYFKNNGNNRKSSIESGIDFCKKIKERYGDKIDFVIINNYGVVKYNTKPDFYNYSKKEWFNAYHYSRQDLNEFNFFDRKYGKGDLESARKILGPQLFKKSFNKLLDGTEYSFLWVDSSERIPPSGVYPFYWGGIFVFIDKELLRDVAHIKYYVFDYANNKSIITGIYDNRNLLINKNITNKENVINVIKESINQNANFVETDEYYICHQFITKGIYALIISEKKNSIFVLQTIFVLIFVVYFVISYPIIKYCWNTIVLKISGNASIRLKLAFLFLYATGIPLVSLAVIVYEYELHKRLALLEEARLWSVENLLGLEQRYSSFLKKLSFSLDSATDELINDIRINGVTKSCIDNLRTLADKNEAMNFFCIGSETSFIGADEGLLKYTGQLESIKIDGVSHDSYRHKELTLCNIIVKKLCSDLNGSIIPDKTINKLELVAESMIQKSFAEVIYTIIETLGYIKEWGLMNISNMSYFRFLPVNNKKITDYIVLFFWRTRMLQKRFINSIIDEANRNISNFKIIAYERFENKISPDIYINNSDIVRFAQRAVDKPTEEIETIKIDEEEYLAVSFLGRKLNRYSFVGLYPIRNIDNKIYKQSFVLWLLGIFSLILSIGLAQLLTKSFINPLQNLQEGALAIENRNFKYRLSNLDIDEFGEVGSIFNHVMVGLEELEVAKIVQESMFPKPEFKQGNFSIYGKAVTMIDVSGDYFDFFKVNDNSFAVLVGDVAGHGVSAAVIMAMAKAAILGAGDFLRSPAELLNYLHKMILATKKPNQKKIMTFQYLHINSETGENLYGNAGACSPWFVRHSQNLIEEIKMQSPVLGAFKKAVYKEKKLDLQPGDAIIFYTDGIVESKNQKGEMIGYERLKNIVLDSWNENPEIYYNNIFSAYQEFVGADAEPSDDLTVVVLMFNQPNEIQQS